MRMTSLECEALIEGWYRDLVDPAYLGIDLEVWLWCLHFPGRTRPWSDGAVGDGQSTCAYSPSTLHQMIGGRPWMRAFNLHGLVAVASGNLARTASELRVSMPELGDLSMVWLALVRGDDDLVSANDAQRSLVVSARALALVRRSEWHYEELSERALLEVERISSVAVDKRR